VTADTSFAVVICTHNGERFLPAQLRSIAAQTHPAAEVHVHDWGSTDGSVALIDAWRASQATGVATSFVRHDRAPGACESFFEALAVSLRRSRSSHFLFCDQDDIWHARKLERYAAHLERQDTDLLFSDVELIDAAERKIAPSMYCSWRSPYRPRVSLDSRDLAIVNPSVGMTQCLSRRLALLLLEHRDAPWPMHDWAAILLCKIYGLNSAYLPEALGAYRQHAANARGAPSGRQLAARLARLGARRRQLQGLSVWAESLDEIPRRTAQPLFASTRRACAGAVFASRNLRAWYKLLLVVTMLLGRGSLNDRRSPDRETV
jgi:glycosyltransferase involved in cell wall biosynthesis